MRNFFASKHLWIAIVWLVSFNYNSVYGQLINPRHPDSLNVKILQSTLGAEICKTFGKEGMLTFHREFDETSGLQSQYYTCFDTTLHRVDRLKIETAGVTYNMANFFSFCFADDENLYYFNYDPPTGAFNLNGVNARTLEMFEYADTMRKEMYPVDVIAINDGILVGSKKHMSQFTLTTKKVDSISIKGMQGKFIKFQQSEQSILATFVASKMKKKKYSFLQFNRDGIAQDSIKRILPDEQFKFEKAQIFETAPNSFFLTGTYSSSKSNFRPNGIWFSNYTNGTREQTKFVNYLMIDGIIESYSEIELKPILKMKPPYRRIPPASSSHFFRPVSVKTVDDNKIVIGTIYKSSFDRTTNKKGFVDAFVLAIRLDKNNNVIWSKAVKTGNIKQGYYLYDQAKLTYKSPLKVEFLNDKINFTYFNKREVDLISMSLDGELLSQQKIVLPHRLRLEQLDPKFNRNARVEYWFSNTFLEWINKNEEGKLKAYFKKINF